VPSRWNWIRFPDRHPDNVVSAISGRQLIHIEGIVRQNRHGLFCAAATIKTNGLGFAMSDNRRGSTTAKIGDGCE